MTIGDARVLVTTTTLYRKKVAPIRPLLTGLEHVLVVPDDPEPIPDGTCNLMRLLEQSTAAGAVEPTTPDDKALLHFTSGTTGRPKGAVHVHAAVVAHAATARYALDLQAEDVFWCTADREWVTGTSYGMIAPLCSG
jgi:acetyl-CoA synthetase